MNAGPLDGVNGEPRVWCAHCDRSELDGTMAADFLRLHIAGIGLADVVGRTTGIHAGLNWLSKRLRGERP